MRRSSNRAESSLHRKSVNRFCVRRSISSNEHFNDSRVMEKLQEIPKLRIYHQSLPVKHLFRRFRE